jgi:hypothetical protein
LALAAGAAGHGRVVVVKEGPWDWPEVEYLPNNQAWTGTDSFGYDVMNGTEVVATAQVSIFVLGTDHLQQTARVDLVSNTGATVVALPRIPGYGAECVRRSGAPDYGRITVSGEPLTAEWYCPSELPPLKYDVPDGGDAAGDSFSYVVSDGNDDYVTIDVAVEFAPPPDRRTSEPATDPTTPAPATDPTTPAPATDPATSSPVPSGSTTPSPPATTRSEQPGGGVAGRDWPDPQNPVPDPGRVPAPIREPGHLAKPIPGPTIIGPLPSAAPSALSVSDPVPAPGQDLTVTGHGGPPKSRVRLMVDGRPQHATYADSSGTYLAPIVAPQRLGAFTVRASCGRTTSLTTLNVALITAHDPLASGEGAFGVLGLYVLVGLLLVLHQPGGTPVRRQLTRAIHG